MPAAAAAAAARKEKASSSPELWERCSYSSVCGSKQVAQRRLFEERARSSRERNFPLNSKHFPATGEECPKAFTKGGILLE